MKVALFAFAVAGVILTAFVQPASALHGGYSGTGASCSACHAIHDATGGSGQSLFVLAGQSDSSKSTTTARLTMPADFANSTTEDLCEYCHVYQGNNGVQVYGQGLHDGDNADTMAQHGIGFTGPIPHGSASRETLNGDGNGGLGCVDCHDALPHAAQASTAVVMASPSSPSVNLYAKDADITSFCSRCHTDDHVTVLGGTSHILTGSQPGPFNMRTTNYGVQTVAWLGTTTCLSCHGAVEFHNLVSATGALGTAARIGVAFTNYGGSVDSSGGYYVSRVGDDICATCHTDTGSFDAYTSGVGMTY